MASANVAAGMKRKSPESSSWSSSGINYEVFLSFRGEDTRKTITDHLYTRLVDAGIQVFRDDENLCGGEEINPQLINAIKRSKISIAVFSKEYASSKSCLMEVEQMWECRISNGQTIIPIFYDISPHDVKHQAGDFAKSFKKHKDDGEVHSNTIQTWKEVLQQIAELVGYERENINGGRESQLVEKVLRCVMQVLKRDDQVVTDKLVGIDHHVQEMMRKLGVVYSDGQAIEVCGQDKRVVGICGLPGVGKTTLARVVYNKMHMLFDGCSFLEGINSRRVEVSQEILISSLQNRKREELNSSGDGIKKMESLFSNMKILIVLDNVHNDEQIQALAGKLAWFGSGSRIIATTDIRHVLNGFEKPFEEYLVEPMADHHALQLFRKHAFQGDAPQDVSEYDYLSIDIVKAIGGLPLAIKLQASLLCRKKIAIWRSTSQFLRRHPPDGVNSFFGKSYNSLDDCTKEIFLDIACFFIGKDGRIPSYMWEACEYYPPKGIDSLCNLHLLEEGENHELIMHNLIRDFGRDIVERKVKRCRFWNHRDALSVLNSRTGTESVQGICLPFEKGRPDCFTCEEFCNMPKLRYLRLDRANIQGNTKDFPQNLRWLDWRECHSIPELCNMPLKELVILDLSRSQLTKNSKFWEQIAQVEELKVLNLQGCDKLHASFNFPAAINLEILILEDCAQLFQIGPFISDLDKLSSLNLNNCSKVKKLPPGLGRANSLQELLIDGTGIKIIDIQEDSFKNLETLSARNCKELEDISTVDRLENLTSLALGGAKIAWVPKTFEFPQKLQRLSLRNCEKLYELPPSIGNLRQLEVMDLSYTGITVLPESVKHLSNLKTLKMECTHLENFPEDIGKLKKLEEIDFSGCQSLEGQVRCEFSGLSSLRILRLSSSNVAGLPESIRGLSRLQILDVRKCKQLRALPELLSSLLSLCWGSKIMAAPKLTNLTNLKELCLNHDEQPEEGSSNQTPNIGWILGLTSLETLELSLPNVTNLPGDFSALTQLRELTLSYMKELVLTQLPSSSSLWTLRLKHCEIQEPKFSGLQYLSELELDDCNLAKIDGLKDLQGLEVLKIFPSSRITDLNELKRLPRLRTVQVFPFDSASLSELRERGCEVDTCC